VGGIQQSLEEKSPYHFKISTNLLAYFMPPVINLRNQAAMEERKQKNVAADYKRVMAEDEKAFQSTWNDLEAQSKSERWLLFYGFFVSAARLGPSF
jgi:hypothetical protein